MRTAVRSPCPAARNPARRRGLLGAGAALAAAALAPARRALAQATERPLRIEVGFAAGGGTDVIARMVGEQLRPAYPAGVIVENRVGASARLAANYVKTAEPDGSVLLFTPDFIMTVYPHSFHHLGYDPLQDFTAVATCSRSTLVLCAGPMLGEQVKSVAEFLAWCRAHPDQASYATTSAGATPHFVGVMLARASGVPLTAVHYKGGAPALQDLLGGQIAASVNPLSEVLPYLRSGRIRALAVTGARRSPYLPETPTLEESGYKGLVAESWLGFFAPARTPPATVARLNQAIHAAVASDAVRQGMDKFAVEPYSVSPGEFRALLEANLEAWGPVVKASGFTAED